MIMVTTRRTRTTMMATLLLMMMMMADLNKEDEDNAEPPELHCCKHCAKDVALHNVVFVSF